MNVHKKVLVFVGTYSEDILFGDGNILHGKGDGIYIFCLNPDTGKLDLINKGFGKPNPSYLTIDSTKRYLYAVNETKEYRGLASGIVSAFSLDSEKGILTLLNRRATKGTDPCHLVINDANTHIMVSNFASGSLSVFPIRPDGSLKPITCFIQHQGSSVNKIRQSSPHVHNIQLDKSNKHAFVVDLGCDKIFIYKTDFNRGKLTPSNPAFTEVESGEGPRHCIFHPSGEFFYVVNELGSSIYSYKYEENEGILKLIQKISTLPDNYTGNSTAAAIKVLPNGNFLYASNRGHNSISVYRIDKNNGKLTYIETKSTKGSMPRDFDFDPYGKYLFAVNQDSHNLVVFKVDGETGKLNEAYQIHNISTPVCVKSSVID